MTIEAMLHKHLTDSGMFPQEADCILAAVKRESVAEMRTRWNDEAEGYSSSLMSILIAQTNRACVSYIDDHKPKHWARPMFTGELA